jgi:hypothetical protein
MRASLFLSTRSQVSCEERFELHQLSIPRCLSETLKRLSPVFTVEVEIDDLAHRNQRTGRQAVMAMNILYATDGSECARIAGRLVAALPLPAETRVNVLGVVPLFDWVEAPLFAEWSLPAVRKGVGRVRRK